MQGVNAAPDANTLLAALDSENNLADGSANGPSSSGTNSSEESIGTVQGVNAAPDLNTQVATLDGENNLSDGPASDPANGGSADSSGGTNSADESIGTVQDVTIAPATTR